MKPWTLMMVIGPTIGCGYIGFEHIDRGKSSVAVDDVDLASSDLNAKCEDQTRNGNEQGTDCGGNCPAECVDCGVMGWVSAELCGQGAPSPNVSAIPPLVGVCGTAHSLAPQGFYSGDFNLSIDGWQPVDLYLPVGHHTATETDDWGGIEDEWWAGHPSDPDSLLAFYLTGVGREQAWRRNFVNDTGQVIRRMRITYDAEVAWTRYQGVASTAANYGLRTFEVEWRLDGALIGRSPLVDNSRVAESDRARWLCDDEVDALGLGARGQVIDVTGLAIDPGVTFELQHGTSGRVSMGVT